MKDEMKVLYVYAHPEPKSFNAALKDTALDALKEKGHEVKPVSYTHLTLPTNREV